MNNWIRLGISAVISLIITGTAYFFPYTVLVYFFAPGFWLGDALSVPLVNALGGYFFPIYTSALIWSLVIFGTWWALVRRPEKQNPAT